MAARRLDVGTEPVLGDWVEVAEGVERLVSVGALRPVRAKLRRLTSN
jgi:hypothetical protein